VPKFVLVVAILLAPLPFLAARRATPASSNSSGPAHCGLVLCEGQAEALRFVLKPGDRNTRDLWLENRSDVRIDVTSVNASCSCLSLITPLRDLVFLPRERKSIRVQLDLTSDPTETRGFAPELHIGSMNSVAMLVLAFDVDLDSPN